VNYNAIIRVPYTTLPNFEKYEGPLLKRPPSLAHLAAKKMVLQDDEVLGQSWFETDTASKNGLIAATAKRLGLDEDYISIKDVALGIEEEIAIIHRGRLEACCFLFPSGWAPEEKVGMSFAELHMPVADGERLRASSERITALMCGEHIYHRYVWGLASSDRLSAHPRYKERNPVPTSLDDIWFRYEHQITVPITKGTTSAFLVDVQVVHYSELSDDHRELILQSIASMSPAVTAYKELEPFMAILFGAS
jgi:hypothetical protein